MARMIGPYAHNARAQRVSAAARAPREPVQTSQPLAGVCACPPHPVRRRAESERDAPRRRRTQTRARTFHEPRGPPENDAERALAG